MANYALVYYGEDGGRVLHFTRDNLHELLDDPYEYAGVKSFLGPEDIEQLGDIESLEEGEAFLLKVEVVKPEPVTKQWRI